MAHAPIAFFVYNRPRHTRETVLALQNNEGAMDSDLIIFSDGPRNEENRAEVAEVRSYLKTISGFKKVRVKERERNFGLADNIIDGVTRVINEYGKIIALEDDMVTSRYFLNYMNNALSLYSDNKEVAAINAYMYPVSEPLPETFFLKGADCWGWATWKRAWALFEPDGKKLLEQLTIRKLAKEFNFKGAFNYTGMLRRQTQNRNNSWAIRWYASTFLAGKYSLYPGISLVKNIGNDASGTHSRKTDKFDCDVAQQEINIKLLAVSEDLMAKKVIMKYLFRNNNPVAKVFTRLSNLFKKS